MIRARDVKRRTRKKLCNGIGPAPGPEATTQLARALAAPFLWLLDRVGALKFFQKQGDDHDIAYASGGRLWHKLLADARFGLQCAWRALIYLPWRWKAPGIALAVVMFAAVLVGGRGPFSERERPLTAQELDMQHA